MQMGTGCGARGASAYYRLKGLRGLDAALDLGGKVLLQGSHFGLEVIELLLLKIPPLLRMQWGQEAGWREGGRGGGG
jgi:hypothetical protein